MGITLMSLIYNNSKFLGSRINKPHSSISCLSKRVLSRPYTTNDTFLNIENRFNVSGNRLSPVNAEAAYIANLSAVIFSITLLGLGIGFVLLRVESLVDEGKINL